MFGITSYHFAVHVNRLDQVESQLYLKRHVCSSQQNRPENDPETQTSDKQSTSVLLSVSVEYVTNMKRIHTTGKEQFFVFFFIFLPPSLSPPVLLVLNMGKGKCHHIYR